MFTGNAGRRCTGSASSLTESASRRCTGKAGSLIENSLSDADSPFQRRAESYHFTETLHKFTQRTTPSMGHDPVSSKDLALTHLSSDWSYTQARQVTTECLEPSPTVRGRSAHTPCSSGGERTLLMPQPRVGTCQRVDILTFRGRLLRSFSATSERLASAIISSAPLQHP